MRRKILVQQRSGRVQTGILIGSDDCASPCLRLLQDGLRGSISGEAISLQCQEEEKFVFHDGATESQPELIESERRFPHIILVQEKFIGIKSDIADVFP